MHNAWYVYLHVSLNNLLLNTMVFCLKYKLIMVFLHLRDEICQTLQLRPVEWKKPFGSVKSRLEVKNRRATLKRVIFQDWTDNYRSRREPGIHSICRCSICMCSIYSCSCRLQSLLSMRTYTYVHVCLSAHEHIIEHTGSWSNQTL